MSHGMFYNNMLPQQKCCAKNCLRAMKAALHGTIFDVTQLHWKSPSKLVPSTMFDWISEDYSTETYRTIIFLLNFSNCCNKSKVTYFWGSTPWLSSSCAKSKPILSLLVHNLCTFFMTINNQVNVFLFFATKAEKHLALVFGSFSATVR